MGHEKNELMQLIEELAKGPKKARKAKKTLLSYLNEGCFLTQPSFTGKMQNKLVELFIEGVTYVGDVLLASMKYDELNEDSVEKLVDALGNKSTKIKHLIADFFIKLIEVPYVNYISNREGHVLPQECQYKLAKYLESNSFITKNAAKKILLNYNKKKNTGILYFLAYSSLKSKSAWTINAAKEIILASENNRSNYAEMQMLPEHLIDALTTNMAPPISSIRDAAVLEILEVIAGKRFLPEEVEDNLVCYFHERPNKFKKLFLSGPRLRASSWHKIFGFLNEKSSSPTLKRVVKDVLLGNAEKIFKCSDEEVKSPHEAFFVTFGPGEIVKAVIK